jgi:hypothetical protein
MNVLLLDTLRKYQFEIRYNNKCRYIVPRCVNFVKSKVSSCVRFFERVRKLSALSRGGLPKLVDDSESELELFLEKGGGGGRLFLSHLITTGCLTLRLALTSLNM